MHHLSTKTTTFLETRCFTVVPEGEGVTRSYRDAADSPRRHPKPSKTKQNQLKIAVFGLLELLLGLLDHLGESGFPDDGVSAQLQGACVRSMLSLAVEHPSQRVRVRSMLVLQLVAPDGPRSLREEDWQRWRTALSPDSDGAA